MTKESQDLSWRLLGWILDIIAVGALAFSINLHSRITGLELWKAETSGNRWNSNMQAQFASQQAQEHTKLWKQMANDRQQIASDISAIRQSLAKMPDQLPPKWWEDYVREKLHDTDLRIKQLEKKIQ